MLITDGYNIKYNLADRDNSVDVSTHYRTEDLGSNPGGCQVPRIRPDRLWVSASLL